MDITEKNLRFRVAYTVMEYWDFTEINGEHFDWEGDERVEQTMYGVLNARQFLWLVLDKGLEETINTQGLQIEGGYIVPAVDFYDADENSRCYVSVYTDDMLKLALTQSQKPTPTPVLQNDFSVKNELLSFIESEKLWDKMVEELPEIIESVRKSEDFYSVDDDVLDVLVPKLVSKLNDIRVGIGSKAKKQPSTAKKEDKALGLACPIEKDAGVKRVK